MDVKDIVGLDLVIPKHISEHLPDDIFEDDTKPLISPWKHSSPVKVGQKSTILGITVKDELNKFSLDNFMECEDDAGSQVAEDDAIDVNAAVEDAGSDIKVDLDDDCIDVETVSEQIPGECSVLTLPPRKFYQSSFISCCLLFVKVFVHSPGHHICCTWVYPEVSGLAAWSKNCKWYSSLPLDAVVSLFCESV
jgi:hypothetical protein